MCTSFNLICYPINLLFLLSFVKQDEAITLIRSLRSANLTLSIYQQAEVDTYAYTDYYIPVYLPFGLQVFAFREKTFIHKFHCRFIN